MRAPKLTDATFAAIVELVAANVPPDEIAARIGCKLSTLKVKCSQRKISLRCPNWKERRKQNKLAREADLPVALVSPLPAPKAIEPRCTFTMESALALSRVAAQLLRQHAEDIGVTPADLATNLLEVIVRDNLFSAVLDQKKQVA